MNDDWSAARRRAGMLTDAVLAELGVEAQREELAAAMTRAELVLAQCPSAPPKLEVVSFRAGLSPKVKPNGTTIHAVEIFKVGKWNGRSYSKLDLADIVAAFEAQHYQVPVKLGHDLRPDTPAVGRIGRVWIEGEVLKADFVEVDPAIVAGIKSGKWLSVSAEIFLNLERNNRKYRAALAAVSILGGLPPGVDLKPLRRFLEPT